MSAVVDKLRQGLAIRTRWPVSNITYSQGGAVLTGPDGAKLGARKVIVTASLAVLQSGRLGFSPALPADKQGALKRLRMGNAAKVGWGRGVCWTDCTKHSVVCVQGGCHGSCGWCICQVLSRF
jgi:lysine-specific histone demethylase 1